MRRRKLSAADDAGSTLPLIIFFAALVLVLVFVVVATTSLYIERKRLYTLADGAALVGAESFSVDDVDHTSSGYRPRLTSDEVHASVTRFVTDNPSDEFTELHVTRAVSVDGRSATVTLSAYWAPPVVSLLLPKGFHIEVTSVARSVFT